MKKISLLLLFFLAVINVQAQHSTVVVKKKYNFTISPRGVKVYKISVPKGAKNIKAVISGQSEMVNLKIYGPTDVLLCRNSTWSYMSNWKKPIHCSVGIVDNQRQAPGLWKVRVEGAVHVSKKNVKKVSGVLMVYIETVNVNKKKNKPEKNYSSIPFEKKYNFTVSSRGVKIYQIKVPKGAKNIKAVISGQSEMVNLKIYGPTSVLLCRNSTWSYMSNWKKPLHCSVGIVDNQRQSPGLWKVRVEGAVHVSKKNVKKVSGMLTIYVN